MDLHFYYVEDNFFFCCNFKNINDLTIVFLGIVKSENIGDAGSGQEL